MYVIAISEKVWLAAPSHIPTKLAGRNSRPKVDPKNEPAVVHSRTNAKAFGT